MKSHKKKSIAESFHFWVLGHPLTFSYYLYGVCMETINCSLLVSNDNGALQDKKSLKLGPEDSLHLEGFALNVFAKADKQDRAGRADL